MHWWQIKTDRWRRHAGLGASNGKPLRLEIGPLRIEPTDEELGQIFLACWLAWVPKQVLIAAPDLIKTRLFEGRWDEIQIPGLGLAIGLQRWSRQFDVDKRPWIRMLTVQVPNGDVSAHVRWAIGDIFTFQELIDRANRARIMSVQARHRLRDPGPGQTLSGEAALICLMFKNRPDLMSVNERLELARMVAYKRPDIARAVAWDFQGPHTVSPGDFLPPVQLGSDPRIKREDPDGAEYHQGGG